MAGTGRRVRGAIVPWTTVAQAAICLGFGAFVIARAISVSLTYDEAAAYIRYIAPHTLPEFDAGPLAIFNFEVATNHFLSTVLTKLSTLIAGSGALALRVPALFGYAMYLWFSTQILRRLTSDAICIAGLLLLNLNPYLLDFFALSRGYGLSIGFMMGALYFFFSGQLARTFVFACAAVLANFSALNVYLGIVALVIGGLHRVHLKMDTTSAPRRRRLIFLLVVAAAFAALVFSQDPGLSASLYQPVTVRVDGLSLPELHSVSVSRIDLRGRVTTVPHVEEAEDAWYAAGVAFRGVRITMPAAASDHLARFDLVVGNREFADDPHRQGAWISRDEGATRRFESADSLSNARSHTREFSAMMNWAGDAAHAAAVAKATAIALTALVLLGCVLNVIGKLPGRARALQDEQWRTVSSSLLWVAALAGPPLYLLRRDAQLYFGGTRGLVPDTFHSLIENSFYGRVYSVSQTQIVFGIIVVTVAAFAALVLMMFTRDRTRSLPTTARMAALIAIVCASLVAQRWLLGTVYLVGRTALFYIPMYLLFFILFCQWLSEIGRIGRVAGASLLVAALSLSAYHFARTANLQYTLDWRDDAGTRAMMADLERAVGEERPSRARVVLGVEWMYAPAAVYYSHRHVPVDIDVAVAPYSRPVDFLYVAGRHAGGAMSIIQTYPIPNAVLARPK